MRVSIAAVLPVAIAAGLLGYWWAPAENEGATHKAVDPSSTAQVVSPFRSAATLDELRQALEAEAAAREALAQELAALKKQVASLGQQQPAAQAKAENALPADHPGAGAAAAPQEGWINTQALVDAGLETSVVEQIQHDFEAVEMEKLYLRDRASREGWLRSQRFFEETRKLNDRNENIRTQYGEDAYDAFLFATGAPNRVEVDSVLGSAPAGVAGIQAGDRILRYDNQRIYSGGELRDATAQGKADDVVMVEVERKGQVLQFYVPRGPLGIRMTSISVAP